MSIILGTVALSYGSVPMYKMVSFLLSYNSIVLMETPDMSTNRLGWSAH